MDTEKKLILVVDDSADDIHFLLPTLASEYAVLVATDGNKALEISARMPPPDIILMDVEMPEMNGYDTCHRLKKNSTTAGIDVIFVSSHNTIDEIIAGYEAGGSDYLTKPVQPDELLQKIKLSINNKKSRTAASKGQAMAMQTAMTAISSMGEQGIIINFMRRSFTASSIGELAKLVVETTAHYGLESSLQIRTPHAVISASSKEPIPPLEMELLSRLKDCGRIMERGARLILNRGEISQLIKNMPADEEKRGRLRDHLTILLEGTEARVSALSLQEELARAVSNSNQSLLEIENMQKAQQESAMQIMDDVMQRLESSFTQYGLSDEQETLLLDIVQNGVDKSLENFEQGLKIDEQMHAIIDHLNHSSGLNTDPSIR